MAWRRWGQPLWAEAHQASSASARREIMRSDNIEVGMAGREMEDHTVASQVTNKFEKIGLQDLVRKAPKVDALIDDAKSSFPVDVGD